MQRPSLAFAPLLGAPAEWFTNFSQGVERKSWGPSVGCLTTSTHIYDTHRDRVLIGLEHLGLQGYPVTEISEAFLDEGFSSAVEDKDIARFAANGMCLPCVGSVLLSYVLNSEAPWWHQSQGLTGDAKRRRVTGAP